ncbi:hypothetical protein KUL152_29370 [Tenacibaculum sp. KUL152]|nr:hypothetical protein KUL152_29370 [Tenacibaculum sp. KUL152]
MDHGRKIERASLSKRETEVAELMHKGCNNRSIAKELNITERTVKFHIGNIYKKYRVQNRIAFLLDTRTVSFERNESLR